MTELLETPVRLKVSFAADMSRFDDQDLGVVTQNHVRNVADTTECPFNASKPGGTVFVFRDEHVATTGVCQHCNEKVHLRLLAVNNQCLDAEVDLHYVDGTALNTLVRFLGLFGFEFASEGFECFLHAT